MVTVDETWRHDMRTGISFNDLNKLLSIMAKAREIDLKVIEDMIEKQRKLMKQEQ